MITNEDILEAIRRLAKGGEGSGNFDHEGRPGEVGGSGPGGYIGAGEPYKPSAATSAKERELKEKLSNSATITVNEEIKEGNIYATRVSAQDPKDSNKTIYQYIVYNDGQPVTHREVTTGEEKPSTLKDFMNSAVDRGQLPSNKPLPKPMLASSILISNAQPREVESYYRPKNMGFGGGPTALTASVTEGDKLSFDYATPHMKEDITSNKIATKYTITHGAFDNKTINIDLSKASEASGQTYTIKEELKANGYRFDGQNKKWINPNYKKSASILLSLDEYMNKFESSLNNADIEYIGLKYVFYSDAGNYYISNYKWVNNNVEITNNHSVFETE